MFFIIKESIKDLKRTLFSSFLTMLLIFISLSVVNIYFITKNNLDNTIKILKSKFEIEIFFKLDTQDDQIDKLISTLKEKEEINEVFFINKDKALELFIKEFHDNPVETIGYNPLPQSLKIIINEKFADQKSMHIFTEIYLKNNTFKDIIDEIHFENYLDSLEVFNKNIKKIGLVLFSIISLLTILLIFNNIRLTIKYKEDVIHTMKLVGASNYMIRMPFIFGGILMGFIAAGLSVISMNYLISFMNTIFSNYSIFTSLSDNGNFIIQNIVINDIYTIFIFGIIIGMIGSWTSVSRYLPKY